MIANAPDIIAWLAIIAEATATTNVGQYNGPDRKIRSFLLIANLSLSNPCHFLAYCFTILPGIDL
jgi:hypothetical protein